MKVFNISPLHTDAMHACRERIDNLTKPIYSLAHLELIAERLAGILNDPQPSHLKMAVLIVGADHLVDGPQNTMHGESSYQIMKRFNEGCTATQGAADKLNATVYAVNVGLEKDTTALTNIDTAVVKPGTGFFMNGPAMTVDEMEQAYNLGVSYAERLHKDGQQVVAIGNVGEHYYLNAMLVSAFIANKQFDTLLEERPNRPSSEERGTLIWHTIKSWNLSADDMDRLMAHVGSLDIAFLTGFIMKAASLGMSIVYDNELTATAVMCAIQMDSHVRDYVFPSMAYDTPLYLAQQEWIGRPPYIYYNITIASGLGATMGLSIIDAALHMLNDMKTFVEAEVTAAEDGPGNERQVDKKAK